MLHELEALEARRIAELAADTGKLREGLLEKIRASALGEPKPARGEHDPARNLPLDEVLGDTAEFAALREAIAALPRKIRQSVWAVMEIGRGRFAARDWDQALLRAAALGDSELVTAMTDEPAMHDCLSKGLYELGMAPPAAAP